MQALLLGMVASVRAECTLPLTVLSRGDPGHEFDLSSVTEPALKALQDQDHVSILGRSFPCSPFRG